MFELAKEIFETIKSIITLKTITLFLNRSLPCKVLLVYALVFQISLGLPYHIESKNVLFKHNLAQAAQNTNNSNNSKLNFQNSAFDQIQALHKMPTSSAQQLQDFELLSKALESARIPDMPKKYIDTFLILNQYVQYYYPDRGASDWYSLDQQSLKQNPTEQIKNLISDYVDVKIENKKLVFLSYLNKNLQAKHYVTNLRAISLAMDQEVIIVADENSNLFAIDRSLLNSHAFHTNIPLFPIYSTEQGRLYDKNQSNQLELSFHTRGLKSFSDEELKLQIENLSQDPEAIYAKDSQGKIFFQAGDLVVFLQDKNTKQRQVLALLNRKIVLDQIRLGSTLIANLAYLFGMHDLSPSFTEKFESYMQIDEQFNKDPVYELIQLLDKYSLRDSFRDTYQDISQSQNPLVIEAIRAQKPHLLKKRIQDILQLEKLSHKISNKKTVLDQFSYEQWYASYEKIEAESYKAVDVLQARLSQAEVEDNRKQIQQEIQSLQNEQNKQNFLLNYQQLLKSYFKASTQFTNVETNIFSSTKSLGRSIQSIPSNLKDKLSHKLDRNSLLRFSKYTSITALMATGAYYSFNSELAVYIAALIGISNWIYSDFFSPVLKSETYRMPSIFGATIMLSIIPMIYLSGYAMSGILRSLQIAIKPLKNRIEAVDRISHKIDQEIKNLSGLNPAQKFSTINFRIYAHLAPAMGTAFELLGQKHWQLARKGISPFTKISPDSRYGLKNEIKESYFLAFNNPLNKARHAVMQKFAEKWEKWTSVFGKNWLSHRFAQDAQYHLTQKNKEIKKQIQKEKVTEDILLDRRLNLLMARIISAEILNPNFAIDPVSLILISKNSDTPLEAYLEKPETRAEWDRLAKIINYELAQKLLHEKDFDWLKLSNEDFLKIIEESKASIAKINSSSRAKKALYQLKLKWNSIGSQSLMALGNWGQEDKEKLQKLVANKTLAKIIFQEANADHASTVIVPVLSTQRSEITDTSVIAHRPNDFLFTNPTHASDLLINLNYNFNVSAATRALVFQSLKAIEDKNYDSIAYLNTQATEREEPYINAAILWFSKLFQFRESNLGAYYARSAFKNITTMQAQAVSNIAIRMLLTDQNFDQATRAFAYTWAGAELAFDWPWTPVTRANEMEENRIEKNRNELQRLSIEIHQAVEQKDYSRLSKAQALLANLYMGQSTRIRQNFYHNLIHNKNLTAITQNENTNKSDANKVLYKKIKSILELIDLNQSELLLPKVTYLIKLIEQENFVQAKEQWQLIEWQLQKSLSLLNQQQTYNLQQKLLRDLALNHNAFSADTTQKLSQYEQLHFSDMAISLAEYSLENPPVYTKVNSYNSMLNTLVFGGILSTYLSIALAIESYKPEFITWSNSAEWMAYSLLFFSTAFLLSSKYSIDNWIQPYLEPRWKNLKSKWQNSKASDKMQSTLLPKQLDSEQAIDQKSYSIPNKSWTRAKRLFCSDMFLAIKNLKK